MFSISGALSSSPYVALVIAIGFVLNSFVENPIIRAEARRGYVLEAEKAAAEAQSAEMQRQAAAAKDALATFKAALAMADKKQVELSAKLDEDTKAYEAKLKAAGRSCRLSRDDVQWLLK